MKEWIFPFIEGVGWVHIANWKESGLMETA
jgi:hypothetical protein